MNKKELKDIIHQVIREMDENEQLDEDGNGSSAGSVPANVTSNIGGFDPPLGMVRRKLNKRRRTNKPNEL